MRLTMCIIIIILCIGTIAWGDKIIRDRDGNTIETESRQGDSRIYRDSDGNVVGSSDRSGITRIYRDDSGDIVATEDEE